MMRRRLSPSEVHDITEQIKALIIQHGTIVINKSTYSDGDTNTCIDITQDDSQYFLKLAICSNNIQEDQVISTTVSEEDPGNHSSHVETQPNEPVTAITSTQSSRSPKRLGKITYTPQQRIRMINNKGIALRLRRARINRIKNARKKHNKLQSKVTTHPQLTHPECPAATEPLNIDKEVTCCFYNTEYDEEWLKPSQPREKFVQMTIIDLLAANWGGVEYAGRRYINIVGTIVGINTKSDKIQLILDDSTGRITCVVEPPNFKHRTRLNKLIEKREAERETVEPVLDKEALVKISKESDQKIVNAAESDKKFNGDLQDAYSYIMLQKAKYLSKEYPQKKDLCISGEAFGKHVSVTGTVYDWTEQRVVYAWDVKFISLDEFFIRLGKFFQP